MDIKFKNNNVSIYNTNNKYLYLYKFLFVLIIISILGYFIPNIGKDYENFTIKYGTYQFYINDVLLIISGIVSIPLVIKKINKINIKENKIIIYIAFIYLLYQTFVILPISFYENIRIAQIFRAYSARLYYIYFLFLYFCIYDGYKIETMIKYINTASVILFIFGIYNISQGIIGKTDTGEMRLFGGYAVLIFGFTFIFNFFKIKTFSFKNYYVVISILGILSINHRSGYLAIGVILIIALFFIQKKMKYIFVLLFSASIFITLINSSENNLSLDFKSRSQRILDPNENNAVDRQVRWALAFDYYLDNPINGSLLSGENYKNDIYLSSRWSPHNFIFETLSTEGTIGILFIFIFYFYLFKVGFKNSKKDIYSFCSILYLTFYLCFCFFNTNYYNPKNVFFQLIAAYIILIQNEKLSLQNEIL